jgi:hypothetical protein
MIKYYPLKIYQNNENKMSSLRKKEKLKSTHNEYNSETRISTPK